MEDIRPNHGYWKSSAATGKLSSILHLSQDHWKLYFTHSAQKLGLFITSLSLRASPSPRVQRPRLQRLRVQRTSPSPTFSRPRVPASPSPTFPSSTSSVPRRSPHVPVPLLVTALQNLSCNKQAQPIIFLFFLLFKSIKLIYTHMTFLYLLHGLSDNLVHDTFV